MPLTGFFFGDPTLIEIAWLIAVAISACAIAWLISAVLKFLPERESEVISRSQMARNPKPSLGNVVEHNLNLACLFNARQGAALSNPVVTKLLRKCFRYVGHIRLTT